MDEEILDEPPLPAGSLVFEGEDVAQASERGTPTSLFSVRLCSISTNLLGNDPDGHLILHQTPENA